MPSSSSFGTARDLTEQDYVSTAIEAQHESSKVQFAALRAINLFEDLPSTDSLLAPAECPTRYASASYLIKQAGLPSRLDALMS